MEQEPRHLKILDMTIGELDEFVTNVSQQEWNSLSQFQRNYCIANAQTPLGWFWKQDFEV